MGTGRRRALLLVAALAVAAGACGDDDEAAVTAPETAAEGTEETGDGDDASGTEGASGGDASEVKVSMIDYAYEVEGSLAEGTQTFTTTNDGEEIHMMGVGRLKDGTTDAEVQEALAAGDPSALEGLLDGELGTPGHIIFPGVTQRITLEEGLDAGKYAMVCFIPTEGEGVPHLAKGMIKTFDVGEGPPEDGVAPPEAMDAYSLPDDEIPDGPAEIEAGEVTFDVTNDGEIGKDFVIAQLDDGKELTAFDEFFGEIFEGEVPPPEGSAAQAPGEIAFSTFEIAPRQTIRVTLTLTPGTWQFVNTMNSEEEGGEPDPSKDKVLEVVVS